MVFSLLRLLLIVLLIIPSSEASQDFDPINYLNTIETIRGEFIQQEGSSQIRQKVSGEIFIRKPNQLLWSMESPSERIVLISENTITYFDADLDQVVISDYLKEDQVSWVNLFLDRSLIESSYNFNQKKLNNGETHIRFDDMKGDYKSVTLIFKSGFLQGINLIDKTANSISIEFTKFEINQTLSDNLFNYQFPSSADIIDQRR
tara:strand:- start:2042 stop:2653 length:612 start_codon:yes stop_codon:yes gene_type:complete